MCADGLIKTKTQALETRGRLLRSATWKLVWDPEISTRRRKQLGLQDPEADNLDYPKKTEKLKKEKEAHTEATEKPIQPAVDMDVDGQAVPRTNKRQRVKEEDQCDSRESDEQGDSQPLDS